MSKRKRRVEAALLFFALLLLSAAGLAGPQGRLGLCHGDLVSQEVHAADLRKSLSYLRTGLNQVPLSELLGLSLTHEEWGDFFSATTQEKEIHRDFVRQNLASLPIGPELRIRLALDMELLRSEEFGGPVFDSVDLSKLSLGLQRDLLSRVSDTYGVDIGLIGRLFWQVVSLKGEEQGFQSEMYDRSKALFDRQDHSESFQSSRGWGGMGLLLLSRFYFKSSFLKREENLSRFREVVQSGEGFSDLKFGPRGRPHLEIAYLRKYQIRKWMKERYRLTTTPSGVIFSILTSDPLMMLTTKAFSHERDYYWQLSYAMDGSVRLQASFFLSEKDFAHQEEYELFRSWVESGVSLEPSWNGLQRRLTLRRQTEAQAESELVETLPLGAAELVELVRLARGQGWKDGEVGILREPINVTSHGDRLVMEQHFGEIFREVYDAMDASRSERYYVPATGRVGGTHVRTSEMSVKVGSGGGVNYLSWSHSD